MKPYKSPRRLIQAISSNVVGPYLLLFFLLISYSATFAQQFRPKWVNHLAGGVSGICQVFDLTTDKQNNVYIAGNFSSDTVDFDPGPGVKLLKSDGNEDIFVGKYKQDGTLVWAESFPSLRGRPNTSGVATLRSIAVDHDGNITVAGALADTLDADPGPGVHYLNPSQGSGLLIHLDNNGNYLWANAIGNGAEAGIEQVANDSQGNVLITTTFSKATIVGDSAYTSPAGLIRGLIVKYSPEGNVLWSVCLQNDDFQINQRVDDCRVDSHDNVLISGTFNYTVNFNPRGAPVFITAPARRETFVAKYTPSGIFSWIDTVNVNQGVIYDTHYPVIEVDQQDNVYFESSYQGFATFGGAVIVKAQGYQDLCFAKYSPEGVLRYAKSIGGPGGQVYSFRMTTDKAENLYLCGDFHNSVNFNPNPGDPKILEMPDQGAQAFVAEYDRTGNYVYAFALGDPLCGTTYAFSMTVDHSGNIDLGGQFCATASLDPSNCSTVTITAKSTYYADGFVVQYAPTALSNNVVTAPSVVNFCTSGTPGTVTGNTPSGGIGGYTYQWQSSADSVSFADIAGANAINYTPPALTSTTYYRRVVSQTCATSANSNIIGIYISNPPAAPSATGDTICTGGTATLAIVSPQANLIYNWYASASAGPVLFTGSTFVTPSLSVNTTYYTEAGYSALSCSSLTRTAVTVAVLTPPPIPVVRVDSTTLSSITFKWAAVSGATGYLVSTDGGQTFSAPTSGPTGLSDLVSGLQPSQSVTLVVEAIGSRACNISQSAPVTASPVSTTDDVIYVPNAFTPNGDGKNDRVHVHGVNIKSMKFYVYDQWGALVFSTADPAIGWDGSYKGAKEPVGVYVYYVQAIMNDGQTVNQKGTIALLK